MVSSMRAKKRKRKKKVVWLAHSYVLIYHSILLIESMQKILVISVNGQM